MSLHGDMNRARTLCDQWLSRSIGQYTEKSTGRGGVTSTAVGMGQMMVGIINSRNKGQTVADVGHWTELGKVQAQKQKDDPIRCNESAALIAFLLSSTRGTKSSFDIVSQGDPRMHGHWFVVVNNPSGFTPSYPNTFHQNSFVVDIWGAIHASTNQKRKVTSSVIYPGSCLFDASGDNLIKVVCAQAAGGFEKSSKCYLTTATCAARGMPDRCEELETLRRFRDTVLAHSPAGRRDIGEYYATAPSLTAAIDRRTDRLRIYDDIYRGTVCPAVEAVHCGEHARAHVIYREGVLRLKAILGR